MKDPFSEIVKVLDECESIACFVHKSPDGDALGSALAIYNFYGDKKRISIYSPTLYPEVYSFLPGIGSVIVYNDFSSDVKGADVALFLDCGDIGRVPGFDFNLFREVVNIDHHESNGNFGSYNLVDPDAPATSTLVYELLKRSRAGVIDTNVAICLYTGLYTDTGGFRYSNTSEYAFKVAGELVSYGIDPSRIAFEVYENYPFRRMKLLALALETLELFVDGKVAVMTVYKDFFDKVGATPEDTEDFVNYARAIKGVEVGIFIRERLTGGVKVSLRSKSYFNVSEVARIFGGGGHNHAAGCELDLPPEEAKLKLLAVIKERLG